MISQKKLGIVAAFEQYQANLTNSRWAVSAIAADGSLVISCWETNFRTAKKALRYEDALSRWAANNAAGSDLLKSHLEQAQRDELKVRLVIAHWSAGANSTAEYFHVRPDVVSFLAAAMPSCKTPQLAPGTNVWSTRGLRLATGK